MRYRRRNGFDVTQVKRD